MSPRRPSTIPSVEAVPVLEPAAVEEGDEPASSCGDDDEHHQPRHGGAISLGKHLIWAAAFVIAVIAVTVTLAVVLSSA